MIRTVLSRVRPDRDDAGPGEPGAIAQHSPSLLAVMLWPLAVLRLANVVTTAARTGRGFDLKQVWLAVKLFERHGGPYTLSGFRYPPSALLLFGPLGGTTFHAARLVFLAVNVLALLVGCAVTLQIFGLRPLSAAGAGLLLGLSFTEALVDTLSFGNPNNVVFLLEAVFLLYLCRERSWPAGVALGLSLAVKPVLLPLVLLPLALRRWKVLLAAAAVVAVLNAAAVPFLTGRAAFLTHVLPFLLLHPTTRFNAALAHVLPMLGTPAWAVTLARVTCGIVTLAAVALLWRRRDELAFWAATLAGILLLGEFLVAAFSEQYYSIYLVPLLVSVVRPASVMRLWPAWLGVYAVFSLDRWPAGPRHGAWLHYAAVIPGVGWAILLVVALWLTLRLHRESRQGHAPAG